MHLALDQLILHELDLSIADHTIAARRPEWDRVLTSRCREHFVKGIAAFCGLELLDYETADIRKHRFGLTAKIRSKTWVTRQPR